MADATVAGMKAGRDLCALMREIRLPPELALSEVHGKVSWGVRSIWEGYTGWFRFDATTDLYPVPASSIHADRVDLAGGPDALVRRAAPRVGAGPPAEALHLLKLAVGAAPEHRGALETRPAALELLLRRSRGVNHHEVLWLEDRIARTREAPGSRAGDADPARPERASQRRRHPAHCGAQGVGTVQGGSERAGVRTRWPGGVPGPRHLLGRGRRRRQRAAARRQGRDLRGRHPGAGAGLARAKDRARYPVPVDELQAEEAPGFPPTPFIRKLLDWSHRGRGRLICE